jgi:dTDP-4-dehydrorhamnose reductase
MTARSRPDGAGANPRSSDGKGPLELWGGHECTVNRVGDRWLDQTVRSGHEHRIEDLALFADIGFKALRYPVLWERVSPEAPDQRDWRWTDERLNEIRRLGMRPIAGLIHHGSGPRYTHLLDPAFAAGLAEHARAAAERYPWVEDWTPVNEPLTTARFSALYGHWYPHARDEGAFFTALLNQIDAVRLSMRAIRETVPNARLIQTEDLGHTFATPPLAYQAEFDNSRRWLAWDLLTGKVDPDHPFWARIEGHGLGRRLGAILEDPCPPDVLGVNYYLSSERFLDHRVERYPLHRRGGNGEHVYADVEAVRSVAPSPMGLERLLQATWTRYGRKIAVTECHNGCTREEQMRWLNEAWRTAETLHDRGVPIEAVTAWSLLGAYDWDRLLTVEAGHYEAGVFDLRGGSPRPTGAVEMCRRMAHGEPVGQPVLNAPGWWSRDIRFEFEPVWCPHPDPVRRRWSPAAADPQPVLITGATGTLGRALARGCEHRGIPYVLTCRNELAIDSPEHVEQTLASVRPWAVINAAGWVRVDEAEADEAACRLANTEGPAHLARVCAAEGLRLVTYSSDLVFDGTKGGAYVEDDAPAPLSAYGRSKAEAEAAVLQAGGRPLVVRTAAFFSPFDPHNFAQAVVRELSAGRRFEAARDLVVSPTYTPDLVNGTLDLLVDGETGLWHLANEGALSWAEFAVRVARAAGLDERLVAAVPADALGWPAARPASVALASRRGRMMPSVEDAISRFAHVLAGMQAPVRTRTGRPQLVMRDEFKSFAPALGA